MLCVSQPLAPSFSNSYIDIASLDVGDRFTGYHEFHLASYFSIFITIILGKPRVRYTVKKAKWTGLWCLCPWSSWAFHSHWGQSQRQWNCRYQIVSLLKAGPNSGFSWERMAINQLWKNRDEKKTHYDSLSIIIFIVHSPHLLQALLSSLCWIHL